MVPHFESNETYLGYAQMVILSQWLGVELMWA